MANVEAVVHERNNACLELETGEGADAPQRTITSFMGFTYKSVDFLALPRLLLLQETSH